MEKKQTAVNWLLDIIIENNNLSEFELSLFDICKAKEMEKEQIIDAFWNGDNTDCTSEQNSKQFAEQYYNEIYIIE